jgi:hypothetical protein
MKKEIARAFAVLLVGAIALGLPFALGADEGWSGKLTAVGVLVAAAAAVAAVIVAFLWRPNRPFNVSLPAAPAKAAPRARSVEYQFDTQTWSLTLLKRVEWRRFEELCAAYFEALGFTARATRLAADGGVDLDLYEAGSERRAAIVRCKAWSTSTVGIARVRELRAAMASEAVAEGVLVASGQFTREARDYAEKENIRLISGAELVGKIGELSPEQSAALLKLATAGDFQTPTCPVCAVKMAPRTSTEHGRKFWGCVNYPRCKHTFFSTHNAPA